MNREFQTVSKAGLDYNAPAMLLWSKAKQLGIWDPAEISFEQDAKDWANLSELEQTVLMHLTTLFIGGEEAVALDLVPLVVAIGRNGSLEESLYLTSFLFEEAKHVEAFRRFLDAIGASGQDLSHFHTPSYLQLFDVELPNAMNALLSDDSPEALAKASVTYNMIVEGVLAETGYRAYHKALTEAGICPGMQEVAYKLKQDESRHIAFGVQLLTRLTAEHGDIVSDVIMERMNTLSPLAMNIIFELFATYETMPFGIELADFTDYAASQFQKRLARISEDAAAA